jgi:hypothetical protein
MLYADKYDNHFLHIECGRKRFTDFATYTLNALGLPGRPDGLAALADPLREKLASFSGKVVERVGTDGSTKDNTADEDDQWDDIQEFIHETDVKVVKPAYYGKPGLNKVYAVGLKGLTQSKKPDRLPNFEAYVKALEAAKDLLTTAPGKAARQLLEDYRRVATTKDQGESSEATLIELLGPEAEAVCWALWDVHCTGLQVYARTPDQAAALFDYGLLPRRKSRAKNKAA